MTAFSVSPDALRALSGRLARVGEELAGVAALLVPPPGLGDDLGAALDDLAGTWRADLRGTGTATQETAEHLLVTARRYEETDWLLCRPVVGPLLLAPAGRWPPAPLHPAP